MAANALDEPSVIHWLERRRESSRSLNDATLSNDPQRWLKEREAFPFYTSSNPHTCEHCGDITINLMENSEENRVQLPYSLPQSVLAARGGCVLYQAFVDLLFDNLRRKEKADWPGDAAISFWIRYFPETLPDDTARLQFTVVASPPTRVKGTLGADYFLTVWALEGDPATVSISARPYELDYQSPASTAWARDCIGHCQLNHSECRAQVDDDEGREFINPASIPSRLLKLYRDETSTLHVKIIGRDMQEPVPTSKVSHQGFAVLSYCWGGPQPIQLTHESATITQDYPITMLPKTLADAAWFTHQLGLGYLWIDALCMFQDDANDKGREIPRMGQYYGDATVTICAASASKFSSGFLTTPPPAEDPKNYLFGPIKLQARTATGKLGTIQALKEADYFGMHREREPIARRGWTLQESLLSRRILIFSSHHLYFSCKTANASCGGREPVPKSRVLGVYESRVSGVNTISSLQRMYPVLHTWDDTHRILGVSGDKLPAISAMAASLLRMAKDERAQEFRYYAGLMFDLESKDRSWEGELLWAVTEPGTLLENNGVAFSPSWSWASLQAPIRRWQATVKNSPDEDGIRLLEVDAPLADERNPFGAVKGGTIRLMARTRLFSTITKAEANIAVTRNNVIEDDIYDNSGGFVLVVYSDRTEVDDMLACGGGRVLLIELVTARLNKGLSPTFPAGILVLDHPEESCYQRVGMFQFKFRDRRASDIHQEVAFKRSQTLFANSDLQELCIK
ncbi:hypothetical protein NUW58_g6923 [Xylaria curta]|uniref:Uncharacterized protein n=1 Tax=Xylaria curta TaxID=42375 RepID=A0ACC1NQ90_9PEZI|nr:hypothetical protein NUW58_g6923 [Xylaria curta]